METTSVCYLKTGTPQEVTFPTLYHMLTAFPITGSNVAGGFLSQTEDYVLTPDFVNKSAVGFQGPNFSTLDEKLEYEFITDLSHNIFMKDDPVNITNSCSSSFQNDWSSLDALEPSITWSNDFQLSPLRFEMDCSSEVGTQELDVLPLDQTTKNESGFRLLPTCEAFTTPQPSVAVQIPTNTSENSIRQNKEEDACCQVKACCPLQLCMKNDRAFFGNQSTDLDVLPKRLSPLASSLPAPSSPEEVSRDNSMERFIQPKGPSIDDQMTSHNDLSEVIALALSSAEAAEFDLPDLQDAFLKFFERGDVSAELDSYFTKVSVLLLHCSD
ncbi:unnamed protein product [Calicophoron daubneyi]|uniref:Uncharacterized protein n=1 Tax=Calicophoron daubneyi TaxID=300641 RepID=A0AAV2TLP4_CALDB